MFNYRAPKKKKKLTTPILIGSVVLIVCAVLIFVLVRRDTPEAPSTSSVIQEGINYDPPTEEDKEAVEQNKEEISQGQTPASTPPAPDGRTSRTPIITYAQQYDANIETTGYVPGVFEDGGTCKATFSKGSLRVVKESAGFADVNRTSCTPISVPVTEFTEKGKWTVVLSYESSSSTGVSNSVEVEVK